VLTKSDLTGVPPAALTVRLGELNNTAAVLTADHGRIDPQRLFDCGPYDPIRKSFDVQAWLASDSDGHSHPRHDAAIASYAIVREAPIRAVTLTLLLETLAEHCGADLLRLKGIVNVVESPDRPAVIHGVQHVFHAPAWLPRWPSDDRRNRIVVIARAIPRRFIAALIDALDAEVAEVDERPSS
jgi:G3E family GTPase